MGRVVLAVVLCGLLAGCATTSPDMTHGYVPRDSYGQPVLPEIGKRLS